MADKDITVPLDPEDEWRLSATGNPSRWLSTDNLDELRAAVAEILLRKKLREDTEVSYVWFTYDGYGSYAKLSDSSGFHAINIDGLRLDQEGTTPWSAENILQLIGIPPRRIKAAVRAARKSAQKTGRYDIVLDCAELQGVFARLSASKKYWYLRVNR